MAPSARRVDRAGNGAAQDPVGAWLADGAEPVPVDTLLAYTPADVADAERYCLALYHQLDIVSERPADAIAALWARSAQLDPERRLMKAAFDLSLLDVCYETLRHAGVFGRWIRPRPKLALLIARSRCLQTYYGESERRAQTTRFSTPMQYVKDLVRNLLLMLFLFVTIGKPQGLVPTQITLPYFGRAVLQAALIAIVTSAVVIVLRRALHLPRSPTVSVADQHTAQALKAGPVSFLMRSIVYDLLDEIIRRWMGVFSLAFLLSLLELALMNYVGCLIMVAAAVAIGSEGCSPVAVCAVSGLAAISVIAQLTGTSLLWNLGQWLNTVSSWILLPLGRADLGAYFPSRPDLLTAIMLSQIRLPTAMTLKPWRFADLFSETSHMFVSWIIWSVALAEGLSTALLARIVFSAVSGVLLHGFQGRITMETDPRLHAVFCRRNILSPFRWLYNCGELISNAL